MDSSTEPITAWVRQSAAAPREPQPLVQRPLRLRRKLAIAVRDGVAEAAAVLYPETPQAREHLAALLLESDSETWPLVDGTDPIDLVAAVREWLTVADPDIAPGFGPVRGFGSDSGSGFDTDTDPGADLDADAGPADRSPAIHHADHPLLIPLCVGTIESIRRQAVRGGDDAILALWLDFEEASGIDTSRLPMVSLYPDDEDEPPPADPALGELQGAYSRRRLPSLVPWVVALACIGIAVDLAKLTEAQPGWISGVLLLAVVAFFIGRAWTSGDDEPRSSDVELLEVYEHGLVVNTATGKEFTVRSVRLWAPGEGPIDHRTRGLKLVWSSGEDAEPVFTDLDEFASSRSLKRALVQGDFVRAEPPAMEN
ncbi:hypothetical protein [Glycomyces arizonensis]|uniref:hypothetical protein n=1 Tax=Glycomyces arizonensis TaxID=256035 RepID=UPI00041AA25E|nr:hypothetical protein [Glycomyces arizonensis]